MIASAIRTMNAATDDRTRKETLKAFVTLSNADKAVGVLHHAGAISVIHGIPNSIEEEDIGKYKSSLMKRFQDLRLEV